VSNNQRQSTEAISGKGKDITITLMGTGGKMGTRILNNKALQERLLLFLEE
jgi:hypothetical protein